MDALQIIVEPRRRQILELVWNDELAAGEIAARFDVSFGAISQHLAVLRGAGFVHVRKDGNRRLYRANRTGLAAFRPLLEAMWSGTLDQLAAAIERDTREGEAQ